MASELTARERARLNSLHGELVALAIVRAKMVAAEGLGMALSDLLSADEIHRSRTSERERARLYEEFAHLARRDGQNPKADLLRTLSEIGGRLSEIIATHEAPQGRQ